MDNDSNIVEFPHRIDLHSEAMRIKEAKELDGCFILGLKGESVHYAREGVNRLELIGILEDFKQELIRLGKGNWDV
jgi:hypothetical protein